MTPAKLSLQTIKAIEGEKPVKRFRKRKPLKQILKTAGHTVADSMQDVKDREVPNEDGTFPPKDQAIILPTQEMTRKQYNDEVLRHAKLLGYDRYLKSIKFDDLKCALARDDSPKAINFLAALLDPEHAHLDIGTIAQRQGISLNDLMTVWRNDRMVETFSTFFTGAPKVAAHAVEVAQGRNVCCSRCDGAGEIMVTREAGQVWIACPHCEGKGTTLRAGDAKAREAVLRATGIVKPESTGGSGTTININTASAVESVIDELERLPAITVKAGKDQGQP